MPYGLIAGAGRFPILALQEARRLGHQVVVIALREEASPDVEAIAWRCHWISIGELGKLIEILKSEAVEEVVMAGQVKHARIFSSIRPDWRLVKLLASLKGMNTDALIGGVAKVLADEGIRLTDSTALLKALLANEGSMTKRKPSKEEQESIDYGPGSPRAGRFRYRPKCRHRRPSLRCRGGDGRHRRHAAPGGSVSEWTQSYFSEGFDTPQADAIRRARRRTRDHLRHA